MGDLYFVRFTGPKIQDDIDRLKNIIKALNHINKEIAIVLPLHPRTRSIIQQNNIETQFKIIDPLGYFDMLGMLQKCHIVVTDSGGLQKEAFFFKKYCLTLRDETEWNELVTNGYNFLVGADYGKIIETYSLLKCNTATFDMPLYGDGHTGEKIH